MAATIITTAIPSSAYTASGTVDIGAIPDMAAELAVYINLTALTGTSPAVTVTYQSSPDGVTFWDHTAGSSMTAVSKTLIKVPNVIGKYGRLSYAITGTTPSITFSAVVEAKRLS